MRGATSPEGPAIEEIQARIENFNPGLKFSIPIDTRGVCQVVMTTWSSLWPSKATSITSANAYEEEETHNK